MIIWKYNSKKISDIFFIKKISNITESKKIQKLFTTLQKTGPIEIHITWGTVAAWAALDKSLLARVPISSPFRDIQWNIHVTDWF